MFRNKFPVSFLFPGMTLNGIQQVGLFRVTKRNETKRKSTSLRNKRTMLKIVFSKLVLSENIQALE
jgi:hypothetical protein